MLVFLLFVEFCSWKCKETIKLANAAEHILYLKKLSVYLSIYLCIYLSISVSIPLSIYLSIYVISTYLPTYLSIYLSVYLSIHPSIHPYLFACLSVCQSIYFVSHSLKGNLLYFFMQQGLFYMQLHTHTIKGI